MIDRLAGIARRESAAKTGRPTSWREACERARACIAQAREEVRKATDDLPPIPKDWDAAMAGPHAAEWQAALAAEKAAMAEHGTFEPAPDYRGKTVKSKLVYRVTREPDGTLKFKVRLVAQGFSERPGIDYFETFAPTIATRSLHILLHIAAAEDREMRHVDVAGAYLESPMDTVLYMKLPLDYSGGAHIIVKLIKALYGLKQAGELWNKHLDKILQELGYTPSYNDPCVYYKAGADGKPTTYLCVYVDDILVVGHSGCEVELDAFDAGLRQRVHRIKSGPVQRFSSAST
jgi:hypothetical protein